MVEAPPGDNERLITGLELQRQSHDIVHRFRVSIPPCSDEQVAESRINGEANWPAPAQGSLADPGVSWGDVTWRRATALNLGLPASTSAPGLNDARK